MVERQGLSGLAVLRTLSLGKFCQSPEQPWGPSKLTLGYCLPLDESGQRLSPAAAATLRTPAATEKLGSAQLWKNNHVKQVYLTV